jgi:hypothetical protein
MTGKAGLAVTESIIRQIGMPAASAQEASQTGLAGDAHSPVLCLSLASVEVCAWRGSRKDRSHSAERHARAANYCGRE